MCCAIWTGLDASKHAAAHAKTPFPIFMDGKKVGSVFKLWADGTGNLCAAIKANVSAERAIAAAFGSVPAEFD